MTERKINHLSSLKDLERQSRTKVNGIQKNPHITDKLTRVNSGYLHSGDVFSRKCIGSVTDQEASLTHSSVSHHHTLDGLHLGRLLGRGGQALRRKAASSGRGGRAGARLRAARRGVPGPLSTPPRPPPTERRSPAAGVHYFPPKLVLLRVFSFSMNVIFHPFQARNHEDLLNSSVFLSLILSTWSPDPVTFTSNISPESSYFQPHCCSSGCHHFLPEL